MFQPLFEKCTTWWRQVTSEPPFYPELESLTFHKGPSAHTFLPVKMKNELELDVALNTGSLLRRTAFSQENFSELCDCQGAARCDLRTRGCIDAEGSAVSSQRPA